MKSIYITTLLTTAVLFAPCGKAEDKDGPANLSIKFELFSMPTPEAAKLMRMSTSDEITYDTLVANGKQESVTVINCRSGQKASSQSISELIYPTEYEPAELPHTICINHKKPSDDKKGDDGKGKEQESKTPIDFRGLAAVATPVTATAFETRNTGLTLEVQAVVDPVGAGCDLTVAAEFVSHVGDVKYGQGVSTTTMPEFETQRINTSALCKFAQPFVLGTMSKPPFSQKGEGLQERVWFAMMTVTLVK